MTPRKYSINMIKAGIAAAAIAIPCSTVGDELQTLWSITGGEQAFLAAGGHTERGIAYNPATGHLLIASRAGGVFIYVLDATTGAPVLNDFGEPKTLAMPEVPFGGTFPISKIGATSDGVIYAANLTTGSDTSNFKIYRWENEDAENYTLVYDGDPVGEPGDGNGARFGDSLDVRGTAENAQILAGSRAAGMAALISTTNGVDHTSIQISDAHSGGTLSVSFGAGNTIYSKLNAQAMREVSFNPETGAGTLVRTVAIPNGIIGIDVNAASNWVGGVSLNASGTADAFAVYDISTPASPGLIDQELLPDTTDANANNVAQVVAHEDLFFVLDTNNGLVAYRVVPTINPPEFATQPGNLSILEGGYAQLTASITGTKPFTYQWTHAGTNLPGETSVALLFTNITADAAGIYTLNVTNSAGDATSAEATVTIVPSVLTDEATRLWAVPPGVRGYIGDANLERGLAYYAPSNHVLVVSRSGAVDIHVMNGDTGEHLWTMSAPTDVVNGSEPGGFRLNMIAVADDGAIYAANLHTGGTVYKIYRWADDAPDTQPTIAFEGSPSGERYGDNFDARGSGVDTQLIAATRNGTAVAIFTTTDGTTFQPTLVDVPDAGAGDFGTSVAFGEENTFWSKAPGRPLRLVQFDLTAQTGSVLRTYDTVAGSVTGIAYHAEKKLIAGVSSQETPDNVRLYDVSDLEAGPVLIDQDFFATDNANINGTASADFGENRIFALDTNNGILALQLKTEGGTPASPADLQATLAVGGNITISITGTASAAYRLESTTDFSAWSDEGTVTLGADGKGSATEPTSGSHRFFRAVAP